MSLFTARVAGVSVAAATTKTLLQIVPAANAPVRVVEIGISFIDTTSTDTPVQVDLLRQTTAGTSSALTLVADKESDSKAALCSALQTFTAEPTAGNILRSWQVTPIGGLFVVQFPLGREPDAVTNRIGLRVITVTAQAQTPTAYATIDE